MTCWWFGQLSSSFFSIPKVKSGFAQLLQSEQVLREAFLLYFSVQTVNRMKLDFVSALHLDCGQHLVFDYIKKPYAFCSGIVFEFYSFLLW